MSDIEIMKDGSMVGKSFSGDEYIGEHPHPKKGEMYWEYHDRVNMCVNNGFHKGDLSWSDYRTYCMGSGYYDNFDSSNII